MSAMVPTLLLQPLVENAVSHGISRKAKGGTIVIRAETRASMLKLEVWDNGLGLSGVRSVEQAAEEGGIGLANTKTRLAQQFGEAHSVELLSAQGGGVVVRVMIPLQYQDMHHEPGGIHADKKGAGPHRGR
jgi:sensor histidine kinase YesM